MGFLEQLLSKEKSDGRISSDARVPEKEPLPALQDSSVHVAGSENELFKASQRGDSEGTSQDGRANVREVHDDVSGGVEKPKVPCPRCGCPAFWQDRYSGVAGPWRCLHCEPPPIEEMVARWLDVGGQCVGPADDDLEQFERDWLIEHDDEAGRVVGTRRGATQRQRIGPPLPPVAGG